MTLRAVSVAVAAVLASACSQDAAPRGPKVVDGYDLGAPLRSYVLPHKLREISAVVAVDARTLACLQDEKGSLYFFDLVRGEVAEHVQFGPPGDYEGLASVDGTWWVLRSDGQLAELRGAGRGLEVARTVAVAAPQREFEGLCWDARAKVLVVAPKSVAKAAGEKDERPILAFDPVAGTTAKAPLLVVDRDAVLAAAARLGVAVPTRPTRKGEKPLLHLRFAEVAVAPTTGHYWLLSSVDRAVVVVDRAGAVLGLHFFAESELRQPEGATFLPDGRLVLASEGGDGAAVLRVYGPVEASTPPTGK